MFGRAVWAVRWDGIYWVCSLCVWVNVLGGIAAVLLAVRMRQVSIGGLNCGKDVDILAETYCIYGKHYKNHKSWNMLCSSFSNSHRV